MKVNKAISLLSDEGYLVTHKGADIGMGFELYRNRRTEEFRIWLRELFWQQLGRIV